MKEKTLAEKIKKDLKPLDAFVRKMSPFGNAGFPDLMIIRDKAVFIELKQANDFEQMRKKFTPIQNYNRHKILEAGGFHILLGSTKDHCILMDFSNPKNDRARYDKEVRFTSYKDFIIFLKEFLMYWHGDTRYKKCNCKNKRTSSFKQLDNSRGYIYYQGNKVRMSTLHNRVILENSEYVKYN